MPDRRTFLIACGGVAVVPAFAPLTLQAAPVPAATAATLAGTPMPPMPELRIAGWQSPDEPGTAGWLHVNSAWRATWR